MYPRTSATEAFGSNPNVLSLSCPRATTWSLACPRSTLATCIAEGFSLFSEADVWIPQNFNPAQVQASTRFQTVVARMRSGISLEQAHRKH